MRYCRQCDTILPLGKGKWFNSFKYCNNECHAAFVASGATKKAKRVEPQPEPPPVVKPVVADDPRTWSLWDWERYVIQQARGKEEAAAKALKEYTTV